MTPSTNINVVKRERLPFVGVSHEFVGKQHGVANSILFVNAPPGRKIPPHRHDYDEIIVIRDLIREKFHRAHCRTRVK
jgi:hypothetical protein